MMPKKSSALAVLALIRAPEITSTALISCGCAGDEGSCAAPADDEAFGAEHLRCLASRRFGHRIYVYDFRLARNPRPRTVKAACNDLRVLRAAIWAYCGAAPGP